MILDSLTRIVSVIGKADNTGTILFWMVTITATTWNINWIIQKRTMPGNLWSFARFFLMWILVMYFFLNRDISRVHLAWAFPATYIIGFLFIGLLKKAYGGD